jgi:cytochrome b561
MNIFMDWKQKWQIHNKSKSGNTAQGSLTWVAAFFFFFLFFLLFLSLPLLLLLSKLVVSSSANEINRVSIFTE